MNFPVVISKIDANKVAANEADGITTVMKVINIHKNNVDVCYYGCYLLTKLIENSRNQCHSYFLIHFKIS